MTGLKWSLHQPGAKMSIIIAITCEPGKVGGLKYKLEMVIENYIPDPRILEQQSMAFEPEEQR